MIVDAYVGGTKAEKKAIELEMRRRQAMEYALRVGMDCDQVIPFAAAVDDWLRTGKVPKAKKPAKQT